MPSPPEAAIAGIVLAAGCSRRMGRDKRILEVGGEPLGARAVHAALEAGLDPVVLVVGADGDALAGRVPDAVRVAIAHDADRGPGASLARGLEVIGPGPVAAAVLLADMPFVDAGVVGAMVERFRAGTATIVAAARDGAAGPPVVFDQTWFGLLAASPQGGRVILRERAAQVDRVAWPNPVLLDVDRPADLARATRLAGRAVRGRG